jgi:hypothetical protein
MKNIFLMDKPPASAEAVIQPSGIEQFLFGKSKGDEPKDGGREVGQGRSLGLVTVSWKR